MNDLKGLRLECACKMSQVRAMDYRCSGSLPHFVRSLQGLSSVASISRAALSAQIFKAPVGILKLSDRINYGIRAVSDNGDGRSNFYCIAANQNLDGFSRDATDKPGLVSYPPIQRPNVKPKKSWMEHAVFLGIGVLLAMIAASGFRPRFALPAAAATTEIVIKARPKRTTMKATAKEKAVYALDYFFATEPGSKAIILLAICASMTTIGGILFSKASYSEGEELPLPDSLWSAWTFISDPGTHADVPGIRRRLVAVPLTMGGMLFFALLVGLMSDGVSARVDHLQKGASIVIEENHTIVVGWTPKTIPLVKELTVANKTRGLKRSIVILGDKDKEDMDEDLRTALPNAERNGSKIVTRSGVPTETSDLRKCSASMARSIILLSPPGLAPHEADALVLHQALVLAYLSELKADLVVELAELDNVNLLKQILSSLMNSPSKELPSSLKSSPLVSSDPTMLLKAGERIQKMVPVATGDFVMRMLVERALQPQIAAVAGELLHFEGSEFRFCKWPELVGKTFGEILFLFDNAIPCGMRKTRPNSDGGFTLINPPPETVFEEGDRLLVISEDEDSFKPGESRAPQNPRVVPNVEKHSKEVLKVLICGWKHDLKDVLMLLDNSVAKGSEVTILANTHIEDRLKELKSSASFHALKVNHRHGDPLSKKALESLPLENYQKVIVLADQNRNSSHSATTTAMFVRHIQMQRGKKDAVIVAELPTSQDDAIQQVQKTWLNDSVQPEQLQAMVLAHLSEDSDVGAVLDEVISDYGSSLTLRSISTYAQPGEEFDFWELQARAQQLGDLVIAYKCAEDENRWMLNPEHKSKILSWTMTDEVLVLTRPKSTF